MPENTVWVAVKSKADESAEFFSKLLAGINIHVEVVPGETIWLKFQGGNGELKTLRSFLKSIIGVQ